MVAETSSSAPFTVEGKTAIITGAGSGINLAFAALLLSRNCNVVIGDLSLRPEAQVLVDRYQHHSSSSPRALFVPTDVRSWLALSALFDAAVAAFGDFDIVVPGAGVFEPDWSSFWHPPESSSAARDAPDGGRYATLDINLTHPIRATQLALGRWVAASRPATGEKQKLRKFVVHESSVAAQKPTFASPIYGATKAGVSAFVRAVGPRLERELGVVVNAVAPGIIRTPLWTDHPDKMRYVDGDRDAWATPEEVADAMLRCVEDPRVARGGAVLEVGRNFTRLVGQFNDPGPDPEGDPSKGLGGSNQEVGDREAVGLLMQEGWGRPKAGP